MLLDTADFTPVLLHRTEDLSRCWRMLFYRPKKFDLMMVWPTPYLDEVLDGFRDGLHRPLEVGHVVSCLALLMNDHQSGDL